MLRKPVAAGLLVVLANGCMDNDSYSAVSQSSVMIDLYASPGGTGACTQADPCSLTQAQAKVRTLTPAMTGDIQVNLLDGVYKLTSTLEFTESASIHDSGTNGYNVIYQAAAGAHPIISGGQTVTGWTLYDPAKGIYRASLASPTRQLYVNGVRETRARGESQGAVRLPTGWRLADHRIAAYHDQTDLEFVGRAKWRSLRCPVSSTAVGPWQNVVARSTGGSFAIGPDWLQASGQGVTYHLGDFNGDGKGDLLFGYADGTGWHNYVALSTGGSFDWSTGDWLPASGAGIPYRLGDFDGDGDTDILFAYSDGTTWHNYVTLANGPNNAFPNTFYYPYNDWLPGTGSGYIYTIGDFNGDHMADVMLTYRNRFTGWHNIVALSNGSQFVFNSSNDWLPGWGSNVTYRVGKFNSDAKDDLLITYSDSTGWHNMVALSTGSAFSTPKEWLLSPGTGSGYGLGDFNGDGKTDVLQAYADAGGLWHTTVSTSTGTGFAAPVEWMPPGLGAGNDYYVGNFDGIGGDDIILAGLSTDVTMNSACWTRNLNDGINTTSTLWNDNWGVSWIENAYELLDEPGEWYQDQTLGYIYYKPRPTEDLSSANVVAPVLETVISGSGADPYSTTLHNLQFRGLTFAYNTWLAPSNPPGFVEQWASYQADLPPMPGAVMFTNANNLLFQGNTFTHLGSIGLKLDNAVNSSAVIGNVFEDISSNGVHVGNAPAPHTTDTATQLRNYSNTVQDNYVTNVAREDEGGVGIFFGPAVSANILHNQVSSLPYDGIALGWGWNERENGVTNYTRWNNIEFNNVSNVMTTMLDGGGIYTLGDETTPFGIDSRITDNYIHGLPDDATYVAGIYHDSGSSWWDDERNVVIGAGRFTTLQLYHNTVESNYASFDRNYCGDDTLRQIEDPTCSLSGNIVSNNTFYPWDPPAFVYATEANAGLETAYQSIPQSFCGDATCDSGESAASCAKDCAPN